MDELRLNLREAIEGRLSVPVETSSTSDRIGAVKAISGKELAHLHHLMKLAGVRP